MPLSSESAVILSALADAGRLTKSAQQALTADTIKTKSDGSVVTVADYAAQALINHRLMQSGVTVPAMVSEESGAALHAEPGLLRSVVGLLHQHGWGDATEAGVLEALDLAAADPHDAPDDYFTIDPIDGTKGFAAGRQFAVCFARVQAGRCTLAALACPNLSPDAGQPIDDLSPTGSVFVCGDDTPVFAAPLDQPLALEPLPSRSADDIADPIITFSVEPSEARLRNFDRLAALLGGARRTPVDSQAKYAMVARGQADAYFRPPRNAREQVWDHAAGCLLLERAGCVVTDLHGQPVRWGSPFLPVRSGIVGAPAGLHGRILGALKSFTPT